MGKMPERLPATAPAIWGPPTWQMLHYLANGYPQCPTPPVRQHCVAFLKALPWMLPCPECGAHCRSFVLGYPGGPEAASRCRASLVTFALALHNEVAAHTRPGCRPWSEERAEEHYATGVSTSTGSRLWADGGVRLVREACDMRAIAKSQAPAPEESTP